MANVLREPVPFAADEHHAWLGCPNDEIARVDLVTGELVKRKLPGVERRRAGAYLVVGGRIVPSDLSSDGSPVPIDHDEGVFALTPTRMFVQTPISLRAIDNATLRNVWEVPSEGRFLGASEEVLIGIKLRLLVLVDAKTGGNRRQLPLPGVALDRLTTISFVGRDHFVATVDGSVTSIPIPR